jgi:signal transduction histidine kinase
LNKITIELISKCRLQIVLSRLPDDSLGEPLQTSIHIITTPDRIRQQYLNLVRSATSEILLIFPTINAIHREEKIGIIEELKNAVQRRVKIRILSAEDEFIRDKLDALRACGIIIRNIETPTESKFKLLIVDRKVSYIVETRDDSKAEFAEAVGLAVHSISKATVLPFVTIFESFWRETDLYERARESDRVKDEFVNIAAHELRNPIMPILLGADLIQDAIAGIKEGIDPDKATELIANAQMIVRNASRLLRLSEDILQVSRIESGTFRLKLEAVDLEWLIRSTIADVEKRYAGEKPNNHIVFEAKLGKTEGSGKTFTVYCDQSKIAQATFNLLDNAMKFTNEGNILVSAVAMKTEAVVAIQDPGVGIDPEIKSRLFEKFTSRSNGGTGLGLYLSKKIIEAHSGRIWCKDNQQRKGANCGFAIPLDLDPETAVMVERKSDGSNVS